MKIKKSAILLVLLTISLFAKAQNKIVETTGDILLFALPVATIGSTLIIKDKKGTWQFLKGFAVNQVITLGLKNLIDKERPDRSNFNSFPSGHTSTTFQSAAFIQKRYGLKFGIPAYLLASYTGFTRINADKHDIVDVLSGAAIGFGSSYLFTTKYQQEHMKVSFGKNEDIYFVGFVFRF